MMLRDPLDVVSELMHGLRCRDDADQVTLGEPRRIAAIVPTEALFEIETIEGERFRVSVTKLGGP